MPTNYEKSSDIKEPLNNVCLSNEGHASFMIDGYAKDILLYNNASAMQICAFLTLACFKGRNDDYHWSTASYNVISNRLGIGPKKAKDLVSELLQMELNGVKLLERPASAYGSKEENVYDDDGNITDWCIVKDYDLPPRAEFIKHKKRSLRRWILPKCGSKEIWFNKELIGSGRLQPRILKQLWRKCGDVAARLYILLFDSIVLETDIINPDLISFRYNINRRYTKNKITILDISKQKSQVIDTDKLAVVLNKSNLQHADLGKLITKAFDTLEHQGFIRRSVIALLYDPTLKIVKYCYELDCKMTNKIKYKNKIFAKDIDLLANELGFKRDGGDHRFYNNYFALAPSNMLIKIQMVYRLNHSVTNERHLPVQQAKITRTQNENEVIKWMAQMRSADLPS